MRAARRKSIGYPAALRARASSMTQGLRVEVIWNGLVSNFNHLCRIVFFRRVRILAQLARLRLGVAIAVLVVPRLHKGRRIRLRSLARALFPRRILRSPSTIADVGYFLFNTCVYAGIFGMAAVSYQFLTNGVLEGWSRCSASRRHRRCPRWSRARSSRRCCFSPMSLATGSTTISSIACRFYGNCTRCITPRRC